MLICPACPLSPHLATWFLYVMQPFIELLETRQGTAQSQPSVDARPAVLLNGYTLVTWFLFAMQPSKFRKTQ
jgi:hypothetical protein